MATGGMLEGVYVCVARRCKGGNFEPWLIEEKLMLGQNFFLDLPGHWAQLLVVAPQACRAKLALLPSSDYGSNSNQCSRHFWECGPCRVAHELHPSVRP